jgi:hypothetical protein
MKFFGCDKVENYQFMVVFELEMVGNGGRKGVRDNYSLGGRRRTVCFYFVRCHGLQTRFFKLPRFLIITSLNVAFFNRDFFKYRIWELQHVPNNSIHHILF